MLKVLYFLFGFIIGYNIANNIILRKKLERYEHNKKLKLPKDLHIGK